jgi:hypothetical protein
MGYLSSYDYQNILFLNKRLAKFITIKKYPLPRPEPIPPKKQELFQWRNELNHLMNEKSPLLSKPGSVKTFPVPSGSVKTFQGVIVYNWETSDSQHSHKQQSHKQRRRNKDEWVDTCCTIL